MKVTKSGPAGVTAGGAGDLAAGSSSITSRIHLKADELPQAAGRYSRAIGRRQLGLVLVLRCPLCGLAHIHRAGSFASADGALRSAGCGRGDYVIRLARIGRAA